MKEKIKVVIFIKELIKNDTITFEYLKNYYITEL